MVTSSARKAMSAPSSTSLPVSHFGLRLLSLPPFSLRGGFSSPPPSVPRSPEMAPLPPRLWGLKKKHGNAASEWASDCSVEMDALIDAVHVWIDI